MLFAAWPAGWSLLYRYTADLLCLNFCRPPTSHWSQALLPVKTPLWVEAWGRALGRHPDTALVCYIIDGLCQGFRIGFNYSSPLRSATTNMESARQHPEIISDYLAKEESLGRMLGPFSKEMSAHIPSLHINRLGVIPKGHNTGKWRLITDLSYPHGQSVNDGIDPSLCSLSYSTVDDVADVVVKLGRGALLSKVDIEAAYRLIPVHPQDRPLQAMEWNDHIYVDPMLPFSLRSATKIFNAVADALNWYLHQAGIQHILHYLDDFIIITPPGFPEGQKCLAILDRVCSALGVPIAEHKREGPTTCLVFLGIEINTSTFMLCLPADKLQRLQALLIEWGDCKSCSRKELESLIVLLNHACKVVRSGCSFLHRMIDLLHSVHRPPHSSIPIRLNTGFHSDLAWWKAFASKWNGMSFLPAPPHCPTVELSSDASGSWGCGAWYQNSWFQVPWDERLQPLPIASKELIPIILACAAWGHQWCSHRVVCNCDNQVVVACLRTRTSKHKGLMHLHA